MKNLIELSKTTSQLTSTNGVPDYSVLIVTRVVGDVRYHYDIVRTKSGGHIGTESVRSYYSVRKYTKHYNSIKKFEEALKRLQSKNDITKVITLG